MYCSNCGKEIKETDKFCSHCGAPNEHYIDNGNAPFVPDIKKAPKKKHKDEKWKGILLGTFLNVIGILIASMSFKKDSDAYRFSIYSALVVTSLVMVGLIIAFITLMFI